MAKGPKTNKTARRNQRGASGKPDTQRTFPSPKTPGFWNRIRQVG